jgi:hypothetical protein
MRVLGCRRASRTPLRPRVQFKRMGAHVRGEPLSHSPWGNIHTPLDMDGHGGGEFSDRPTKRQSYRVSRFPLGCTMLDLSVRGDQVLLLNT